MWFVGVQCLFFPSYDVFASCEMQCSESVATCIDTGVWTSNFWSEYATQLKELGAVLIVHAGSWFCSDCARRYRVLFYCARRYRVLF